MKILLLHQRLSIFSEQVHAALFYAQARAPWYPPPAGADGTLVERGRVLALAGDNAKQLQGCANCHGPNGTGIGLSFPYLAGQFAPYLSAQLTMWRRGWRKNDTAGTMRSIAERLDPADIAAVTAYYASLRPEEKAR